MNYISESPNNGILHFLSEPDLKGLLGKIASGTIHFKPVSFEFCKGILLIKSNYSLESKDKEIFEAILNRCLKPSWFYLRKRGN